MTRHSLTEYLQEVWFRLSRSTQRRIITMIFAENIRKKFKSGPKGMSCNYRVEEYKLTVTNDMPIGVCSHIATVLLINGNALRWLIRLPALN